MDNLKDALAKSSIRLISLPVLAEGKLLKAGWSIISLSCLAVFLAFLIQSLIYFYQYPLATTVKIDTGRLDFPAVSVCNLNPYKMSAVKEKAPQLYKSLLEYSDAVIRKHDGGPSKTVAKRAANSDRIKAIPIEAKDISNDRPIERKRRQTTTTVQNSNVGNTFYTTFLPNFATTRVGLRQQQVMLATTSTIPFPVTITANGGGFATTTVTLDNTAVKTVAITTSPAWTGLKISAGYDFIAYSMQIGDRSSDGSLLFPVNTLGTEYMVMGVEYSGDNGYAGYVYVIGSQAGTTVQVNFPNGTQQSYTANEMDVISLQVRLDASGTKITSNYPVAVLSGHDCLYWPRYCTGCDIVYEQIPPSSTFGIHFALAPFQHTATPTGPPTCCYDAAFCYAPYEFFKVLALYDSTTITRIGITSETFTLNAGSYKYVQPQQYEYSSLTADKPIMVVHLMQSSAFTGEITDPSLVTVPSTDAFSRNYFVVSCHPQFNRHFMTIIINPAHSSGLLLNGVAFLGAAAPFPIPTTNLVAYQHQFACAGVAQSFTVTHPDPSVMFSVTMYGYGDYMSYAYIAGRLLGKGSYFCSQTADAAPPDSLDNDCDGWVDEEIRNFIDDDNDGLIDEDLAAMIPAISVINCQIISCDMTAPPPVNGSIPYMAQVTAVDPRCIPHSMTFTDQIVISSCSVTVNRTWSLIDLCGNIAYASQVITISKPPDNYTAPPAVYLNDVSFLSDASATGIPQVTTACPDSNPWSWAYADVFINQSAVNRTWTINSPCLPAEVHLQQMITVPPQTTTSTTTTPVTTNPVTTSVTSTTTVTSPASTTSTTSVTTTGTPAATTTTISATTPAAVTDTTSVPTTTVQTSAATTNPSTTASSTASTATSTVVTSTSTSTAVSMVADVTTSLPITSTAMGTTTTDAAITSTATISPSVTTSVSGTTEPSTMVTSSSSATTSSMSTTGADTVTSASTTSLSFTSTAMGTTADTTSPSAMGTTGSNTVMTYTATTTTATATAPPVTTVVMGTTEASTMMTSTATTSSVGTTGADTAVSSTATSSSSATTSSIVTTTASTAMTSTAATTAAATSTPTTWETSVSEALSAETTAAMSTPTAMMTPTTQLESSTQSHTDTTTTATFETMAEGSSTLTTPTEESTTLESATTAAQIGTLATETTETLATSTMTTSTSASTATIVPVATTAVDSNSLGLTTTLSTASTATDTTSTASSPSPTTSSISATTTTMIFPASATASDSNTLSSIDPATTVTGTTTAVDSTTGITTTAAATSVADTTRTIGSSHISTSTGSTSAPISSDTSTTIVGDTKATPTAAPSAAVHNTSTVIATSVAPPITAPLLAAAKGWQTSTETLEALFSTAPMTMETHTLGSQTVGHTVKTDTEMSSDVSASSFPSESSKKQQESSSTTFSPVHSQSGIHIPASTATSVEFSAQVPSSSPSSQPSDTTAVLSQSTVPPLGSSDRVTVSASAVPATDTTIGKTSITIIGASSSSSSSFSAISMTTPFTYAGTSTEEPATSSNTNNIGNISSSSSAIRASLTSVTGTVPSITRSNQTSSTDTVSTPNHSHAMTTSVMQRPEVKEVSGSSSGTLTTPITTGNYSASSNAASSIAMTASPAAIEITADKIAPTSAASFSLPSITTSPGQYTNNAATPSVRPGNTTLSDASVGSSSETITGVSTNAQTLKSLPGSSSGISIIPTGLTVTPEISLPSPAASHPTKLETAGTTKAYTPSASIATVLSTSPVSTLSSGTRTSQGSTGAPSSQSDSSLTAGTGTSLNSVSSVQTTTPPVGPSISGSSTGLSSIQSNPTASTQGATGVSTSAISQSLGTLMDIETTPYPPTMTADQNPTSPRTPVSEATIGIITLASQVPTASLGPTESSTDKPEQTVAAKTDDVGTQETVSPNRLSEYRSSSLTSNTNQDSVTVPTGLMSDTTIFPSPEDTPPIQSSPLAPASSSEATVKPITTSTAVLMTRTSSEKLSTATAATEGDTVTVETLPGLAENESPFSSQMPTTSTDPPKSLISSTTTSHLSHPISTSALPSTELTGPTNYGSTDNLSSPSITITASVSSADTVQPASTLDAVHNSITTPQSSSDVTRPSPNVAPSVSDLPSCSDSECTPATSRQGTNSIGTTGIKPSSQSDWTNTNTGISQLPDPTDQPAQSPGSLQPFSNDPIAAPADASPQPGLSQQDPATQLSQTSAISSHAATPAYPPPSPGQVVPENDEAPESPSDHTAHPSASLTPHPSDTEDVESPNAGSTASGYSSDPRVASQPAERSWPNNEFPTPSVQQAMLPWAAQLEESLLYLTSSLDENELISMGYQIEDMVFGCQYAGRPCNLKTEVQMFRDPNYGNCFTFNALPTIYSPRRGGYRLGLRLGFHTPAADYLPFQLSTGFKILLHEPDEQPMMAMSGVACSPGHQYGFAVRKVKTTLPGAPYKPCATNLTTTAPNVYSNKSYSIETCLGSCYQWKVVELCGCGDPLYPLPRDTKYCDITKKSCVDNASSRSADFISMSACDCLPPCSASTFQTVQTRGTWPTEAYMEAACKDIINLNETDCMANFKRTHSRVDVYYDTMTSTNIEGYAQYTVSQLISDIFAGTGLWLNMCAISAVEIIIFPILAMVEAAKAAR